MRSLSFPTLAICLLALLVASPARGDASTTKARQLYEDGVTNYNLSHFDEALTAFEMAYRIRRDPAFLFNIAQCQRNLKRYEDAQRTFRAYLRESSDLPAATRAQIQQIMAEMEHAQADERAKQPSTRAEAPVERADLPAERQLAAPARSKASVPSMASPPPTAGAYRDTGRSKRLAGIIVADVGVGAVGVAIAFAVLSKQAGDAAYRPANDIYNPSQDDRQRAYRAAEIACFVVGGAAVISGTTIWLLGRKEQRRRVTASATVAPGVAYAGLSVGF